jgi:hypothetical protein
MEKNSGGMKAYVSPDSDMESDETGEQPEVVSSTGKAAGRAKQNFFLVVQTLAAILVIYALSAVYSVLDAERELEERVSPEDMKYVDLPSISESLQKQLEEGRFDYARRYQERRRGSGLGEWSHADEIFTQEGLSRLISTASTRPKSKPTYEVSFIDNFRTVHLLSFNQFKLTLNNGRDGDVKFYFSRKGPRWVLVDVLLPEG